MAPAAPWLYRKSASPPHPQHPNQKLGWRLASRSGLVCIATAWASRREAQSVARAGGDKRPARNPVQRPAPFQLSFQGNLNWRALAAPGRMLPRPLVRRLAWRRDRGGPCGVLVARLAGAVEGRLAAAWAPGQVGGTRPGWVWCCQLGRRLLGFWPGCSRLWCWCGCISRCAVLLSPVPRVPDLHPVKRRVALLSRHTSGCLLGERMSWAKSGVLRPVRLFETRQRGDSWVEVDLATTQAREQILGRSEFGSG